MDTNAAALADHLRGMDALELIEARRGCRCHRAGAARRAVHRLDLVGELAKRRGWMVPAYQLPPDNDDQQILRMLVKINQTRELVDALADDFTASIDTCASAAPATTSSSPSTAGTGIDQPGLTASSEMLSTS